MSIDLGLVPMLGADAVGEPGQRRFRLYTRSQQGSALLWMEKEQLAGLSEVLDRALALITEGQVLRIEAQANKLADDNRIPDDFPRNPTHDMQVGQLRLNYDEQDGNFVLNAVPFEILLEEGQEEPQIAMLYEEVVSFAFTQQQAHVLSQRIQRVITAGRPTCPFCHQPLADGPHACAKQNGHRDIIQVADGSEDEDEDEDEGE